MPRDYGTEVTLARQEVDDAATGLGGRVQTLIDQVNATPGEGLNGPQTEALLANMAILRDNLNGMGHNPAEPFPPIDPVVPIV